MGEGVSQSVSRTAGRALPAPSRIVTPNSLRRPLTVFSRAIRVFIKTARIR